MSRIDQRILIVAPAESIWSHLVEPPLVTKWNRTCKQVSVLSTKPTGLGSRRRCVDENGRTTVQETTAWIENIGYEYLVVDGPYKEFRGRVRLQVVPEGTVVSWTVDYRLRGMTAGLRDVFSYRRKLDTQMTESLRKLRKLLEESGTRIDTEKHARAGMQQAPETRTARTSRAIAMGDDLPEISGEIVAPAQAPQVEPVAEVHPSAADTQPHPPEGLREAIQQQAEQEALESTQPDYSDSTVEIEHSALTVPVALVAPPREPEPETQPLEVTPPSSLPEIATLDHSIRPDLPPPTTKTDTGGVSIWEVFGVERPSDKAQADLDAIVANTQPRPAESILEQTGKMVFRKVKPCVRSAPVHPIRVKAHVTVRRAKRQ